MTDGKKFSLPKIPAAPQKKVDPRICPHCGGPVRIFTTIDEGKKGRCKDCKQMWGMGPSVVQSIPNIPPQGFHKRTLEEPDWSLAAEDLDASDEYSRGSKS